MVECWISDKRCVVRLLCSALGRASALREWRQVRSAGCSTCSRCSRCSRVQRLGVYIGILGMLRSNACGGGLPNADSQAAHTIRRPRAFSMRSAGAGADGAAAGVTGRAAGGRAMGAWRRRPSWCLQLGGAVGVDCGRGCGCGCGCVLCCMYCPESACWERNIAGL